MDLAVLNASHHKSPFCQGEMSDAFVKSNYYGWALIQPHER